MLSKQNVLLVGRDDLYKGCIEKRTSVCPHCHVIKVLVMLLAIEWLAGIMAETHGAAAGLDTSMVHLRGPWEVYAWNWPSAGPRGYVVFCKIKIHPL